MDGPGGAIGHGTRLRWSLHKMTKLKAINQTVGGARMNAPVKFSAAEWKARVKAAPALVQYRDAPVKRDQQKYHNEKVTTPDGIKFDSKAEFRRWQYLAMLEKAKEIKDLRLQVPFELIPTQKRSKGGTERACTYIADFVYVNKSGARVVEDVKGALTPEYRLKRKLLLLVHGIEIQEVRS